MDRPCRLIHSLYFDLGPMPDGPPTSTVALVVHLRPDGTHANKDGKNNGAPRPPKRRTIDLRPGDQMLCMGEWTTIRSIQAFRDAWLTEEQAQAWKDDGYLYLPARPSKMSACPPASSTPPSAPPC